ncbi:MAG: hypothetical protein U9Q39_04855, partial [Pseudomonadota bacterium]|nr:hypothetical protein [Pseudomonadota bacterium]
MRELAREITYRPLFLPLLMIVWAIVGSTCQSLSPLPVLLFATLLALFYYALLGWLKVNPRPLLFLFLVLFSLFLAGSVSWQINSRRDRFLDLKPLLAQAQGESKSQKILSRVTTFPRGS